jgi:hypothetical protein
VVLLKTGTENSATFPADLHSKWSCTKEAVCGMSDMTHPVTPRMVENCMMIHGPLIFFSDNKPRVSKHCKRLMLAA